MVTVSSVREDVKNALNQHFPDINVYGEEQDQGLEKPYFYVKLFSSAQKQLLGQRYQRKHTFEIQYFPAAQESLDEIAEGLYEKMELISVEDSLVRGSGMRHELAEGVLHWFVDYNFQVLRSVDPDPLMQTMQQEGFLDG
ncbi:hypothetical protein Desor_5393 [Desulfosporosinus orientis DSM 765]|uniref:Phage protein n=1 Tax=Desulfosporosinus orientis (strain ATCC 19365 / DSM 765 / NCIMB 8382 / VKM B-1628 / Singapore I) TaxID=768706 RepID=G7WEF6_DESOD|nr:hypothetical protein [Desulfosporosinus orientis]AET70769.1 hypothetical protein Desor_5393 [Desulfosporosinus orientis DSM 765]